MEINGKRVYVQELSCDGVSATLDFCVQSSSGDVYIVGYFDRAKAKVKSLACQFGRKCIRKGYSKLSTNQGEWKTIYKPIRMGRDRFIYAMTFNKAIGESILVSTEESAKADFFNLLLTQGKLPLLEEWVDYIWNRCTQDRVLYRPYLRNYITDDERKLPLHGKFVDVKDIVIYEVDLTNEYLTQIVSEGLQNGQIKITDKKQDPLVFESFDDYIQNYGPSMVNNLEKQIETLSPLKGKVDSVAFKTKRLFPQQAACINGIMALKKAGSKYGLMVEGMGCGKTLQGSGIVDAYFNQKWLDQNPNKTLKDAYESGEVKYRNIMMAPSHLVEKWREEILSEIPGTKVTIIDDFSKLVSLRANGKERTGKEWYLISKDTCKLGSQVSPIPTTVGWKYPTLCYCKDCMDAKNTKIVKRGAGKDSKCPDCGSKSFFREPDKQYGKLWGMICPECGELLLKTSTKLGEEVENPSDLVLTPADFAGQNKQNSICYNCGAHLWGVDVKPVNNGKGDYAEHVETHKPSWYKVSHYKNFAKKSKKSAFVLRGHEGNYAINNGLINEDGTYAFEVSAREYGPRKTAPSLFIKKYLKGYFDFCVLDEAHKYENGGTAQSNAAHALMSVSDFTLCLTGTISNGKADSFFYLLYMLDPRRMNKMGYKYSDCIEFTRKYGTVETVYELDDSKGTYNSSSRGRQIVAPRTKPGISPLLFVDFLLDKSVFLDLSDLSKYIPTLTENVELVPMPQEIDRSYQYILDVLKASIKTPEGAGLLSQILQFGLSYPDKPWGRKPIMSAKIKDCVVANPENYEEYSLADNLLPKEQKLVDIVNSEISEGRNCFVYCSYTGDAETNITYRLKELIEANCNLKDRVQILNSTSPEPTKRERWIKQKASEGIKVFICNPKCVETGLDFCFNYGGQFYNYPTLIFYQMSYELAVIWQASRRHYRLNQKVACRTYYLAYEGTLQAAAVEIMAEKQVAASAIQGKFSAEGLTAMAQGIDPRLKLAQKLAKSDNSDRKTLENMFDALNQSNSSDDEDRYGENAPALTYFELMGISEEDEVLEQATEQANEILNTFETISEVNDSVTSETVETVVETKSVFEEYSFFDFLADVSDTAEETVTETVTVVTDEPTETKVVTPKTPKANKPKKATIEGQISFFDLLSA